MSRSTTKFWIAYLVCSAILATVCWRVGSAMGRYLGNYFYPKVECHMKQDCEHVKETCDRKKGCKCKLNCDPEGRRLPPAGGQAECPSYCCEEKCQCHAMGCP